MSFSLDEIQSPADVKELPEEDLQEFAQACRERLIESVSRSGGHFGASLGVCELTVALHYLYDSPADKLVWDVGHQGYIHKMLTGRNDRLESIRQDDGLAAFLKRSESEHDIFNAGHASTSISAALGISEAFRTQERGDEVVAVIGDGAITAGMAYEAMNNAGWLESDLTVILNDNGMSIAENVGALTRYFDRLVHLPAYEHLREDIKSLLEAIPEFGQRALGVAKRLERGMKNIMLPRIMFEELGFDYHGPVDGHEMSELLPALRRVKGDEGPRFLHVLTEKGHGYAPAEEDEQYAGHSTGPFVVETGEPRTNGGPSRPKWSKWVGKTLTDLADENDRIHAITAAMRKGTQTVQFADRHPDRFYDVGIAEQHAVTFAGGLATQGESPFVCIYSTFLQRAFDQVIHDVCLMDLPVRFILDRAGIVGGDGETHQGIHDMVYLRSLPNIVLGAPATAHDMQRFIKTAELHDSGPIAVRVPRMTVDAADPLPVGDLDSYEVGEGKILRRGGDVALLAVGPLLSIAREGARRLDGEGIEATVVDMRWIKPLDRDLLSEVVPSVDAVVTVEEGMIRGGFGSAVLEWMAEENQLTSCRRMGVPTGLVPHGSRERYLEEFDLTPEGVVRNAREALQNRDQAPATR